MHSLEAQCIKDFLSEVKRWESVPNRRETVTVKMVPHMCDKHKSKHLDSPDSVLCDWNVLGIFYGFHLSEWAQKASDKKQPLASLGGLPLALIFPESTFLGVDRTTVP